MVAAGGRAPEMPGDLGEAPLGSTGSNRVEFIRPEELQWCLDSSEPINVQQSHGLVH